MEKQKIKYLSKSSEFQGYIVFDPKIKEPRPAIIVAHAWKGQDDFVRNKAFELAEMGYIGFAADVYGEGKHVDSNEEALSLMLPLFKNRKELRNRITAAFETVKNHEMVNPNQIGAIGYCFGGLTVLELIRSGASICGAVSFHGVLGNTLGEEKAELEPNAKKLNGSLLIMHGNDDPMVSQEDIIQIQKEFTDADIDWQMNIYGQTMHAFTNPQANDLEMGLVYNQRSDRRSWQSMCRFFQEVME